MQKKHLKTLERIFDTPQRSGIKWKDVESLLIAAGATMKEGSGSRVRISLNSTNIVLHRPHPSPDMDKGAVRTLKLFLKAAGITA